MAKDDKSQPPAKADDKKKGAKKEEDAAEDLSEEDVLLKEKLEGAVERAQSKDAKTQLEALETMRDEVRSSTTSMTAVPKPLRFLRPHYAALRDYFVANVKKSNKNHSLFASLVSVLAMTSAKPEDRETLKYCLEAGTPSAEQWGHEYLRHLAGEIAVEYDDRIFEVANERPTDDLMDLVRVIVSEHMKNNAEPEAVDLLLEVERIEDVVEHCGEAAASRACLYLTSCSAYLPSPENTLVLDCAYRIFAKFGRWVDALRIALKLDSRAKVEEAFVSCKDETDRKQQMYLMARQGFVVDLEDGPCAVEDADLQETLRGIMGNVHLSEKYLALARDLDVMEAKTPDDVYKLHLTDARAPAASVDSARQNLANTFVNAFVNAGFGHDQLMLPPDGEAEGEAAQSGDKAHWIFKNRDHGKMSAAASLGMIMLWDVENGLSKIDRHMYTKDPHVTAGACLAVGICSSSVRHDMDPALALLGEKIDSESEEVKAGAVLGLGLSYAGTAKAELAELLGPVVADPETKLDVAALAALSLGMCYVGTMNDECMTLILQGLMERSAVDFGLPLAPLMVLGLGLLFLGRQDAVEPTLELLKTLPEKISAVAITMATACAYAGTGSVLKVQELLALCMPGGNVEEDGAEGEAGAGGAAGAGGGAAGEGAGAADGGTGDAAADAKSPDLLQSVAVLGVAMIAMGEELGAKMAQRSFDHVLQYCGPAARRAVPLAVALLNLSNPDMLATDVLSRLSHDADADVAAAACLSLGLVGAGTNNARLANMLRQLSSYYYKEPACLFLVRSSQGLVHLGKGLLTLSPSHTDRLLVSGQAMAGVLAVLVAALETKATIAGKHHYLLYCLAPALYPRMYMPVDADGAILSTPARVGEAVDVVAQAGKPKTITGFQTHSTPVLLAVGERAEMATEKYLPRSDVLEGFVICTENPDYVEEVHEKHVHS